MLSRRTLLVRGAAGALALGRRTIDVLASAPQSPSPVTLRVPAGACDCHTHVFGDPRRFPFAPARTYTPEPASVEKMRALHRALHVERVVIVQPSVYGIDNACTLDAIRQLGPGARGIAVIDERATDGELDLLERGGIRGVRINLATAGQTSQTIARHRFQGAVQRIEARRWHLQIFTQLSVIEGIGDLVLASPVPVVFDHFGGAQASLGIRQPGFDALLRLVRAGRVYVKLSAIYRSSTNAPDYLDVAPLARALIEANPERMLWGTDWPHPASTAPGRAATDITPPYQVDDGRVFNQLAVWAPDADQRRLILVENPARLYGF